jgi:hypothetical protein
MTAQESGSRNAPRRSPIRSDTFARRAVVIPMLPAASADCLRDLDNQCTLAASAPYGV